MKLSILSRGYYLLEGFQEQIPYYTKRLSDHEFIYELNNLDSTTRINDILNWIYQSDPIAVKTKGRKAPFTDQILTWFENGVIRLPEDVETTNDTLTKYSYYRNNVGTFPDGEKVKSIDQYESPGRIREHINVETEGKYDIAKLVMTHGLFKVYEIDNWETGRICFADSGWCVQNQDMFEDYVPPYFMIIHNNKRYALVHVDSGQIKDVHDNPLSEELGIPILPIILKLFEGHYRKLLVPETGNIADGIIFVKYVPELAKKILNSKHNYSNMLDMVYYARNVIHRRWPEAESCMLNWANPRLNKTKFTENEDQARPDIALWLYAKDVIKGRWPEVEPFIMKSECAFAYARDIIKGRWSEAEPYIYKSSGDWFGWYNSFLKEKLSAEEYHKFQEDMAVMRMKE